MSSEDPQSLEMHLPERLLKPSFEIDKVHPLLKNSKFSQPQTIMKRLEVTAFSPSSLKL